MVRVAFGLNITSFLRYKKRSHYFALYLHQFLDYIKKEEVYISLNLLHTNSNIYISLAYKNQLSVNQNILA